MSASEAARATVNPAGSIPRGIAAGALACLIAVPVTPVTWLVATVMRGTLYHKVMHQAVSYDELHRHGREALIAGTLVGGATGLIAACIAAWAALTLVRHGRRGAFLATAGLGATLAAMVMAHGLRHGGHAESAPLAIGIAWLLALAGLVLTEMVVANPGSRPGRR
jgi:hypothetical protein